LTLLLDTRLPEDLPLFDFGKNVESKKKKKKTFKNFFSLIRIFAEMVSELEGCNSGGFI
jgi:hypothetical protein